MPFHTSNAREMLFWFMENRNIRSQVGFMVCQWTVQSNVFQHHFCFFRGRSLDYYFFFPSQIKDDVSSVKTFSSIKKICSGQSVALSFSGNLLADMGGLEGNALVLRSHQVPSHADLSTSPSILQGFSYSNLSTPCSSWAMLAAVSWYYCITHKRHTPAGNATPPLLLQLFWAQKIFDKAAILLFSRIKLPTDYCCEGCFEIF